MAKGCRVYEITVYFQLCFSLLGSGFLSCLRSHKNNRTIGQRPPCSELGILTRGPMELLQGLSSVWFELAQGELRHQALIRIEIKMETPSPHPCALLLSISELCTDGWGKCGQAKTSPETAGPGSFSPFTSSLCRTHSVLNP